MTFLSLSFRDFFSNMGKILANVFLKFAKIVQDINVDMVYTIAVYHDLGHHIDKKNHEKISS